MHHGFINAFRKRGKRYLVLQNFTREDTLFKEEGKKYVLASHYDDKGLALLHYKKVIQEEEGRMIDLENDDERKEFDDMLNVNLNYKVYSILVSNPDEMKRAIDKQLKYKIQDYIAKHTNWRISRHHKMTPDLETTFGELFVVLKYSGQKIRVPLKDLEKI